jgi:PAS domain S-box-containing protein
MEEHRIGDFLRAQRERLLVEWEASVRTLPAARRLDRLTLLDDMPQIFSKIIEWVDRKKLSDVDAIEELANLHAEHRRRDGFDLRQVIAEYRILRGCILRLFVEQYERCEPGRTKPPADQLSSIAQLDEAIDVAIADSVDRYAEGRQRAVRDREQQLARILATLPVAVWVADAHGQIELSNEAARRLWGGDSRVPLEEYDQFKAWWPDGRRVTSRAWGLARALRTGETSGNEEVLIETFDGMRKVIRNAAAPILDDDGRIIGGVAVNEDITLLKQSEEAREQFIGILGHDLRSPLTAILMAASLLLRRGELEEPQRRTALRIHSSATRIKQLIDDLLDFTRARFGDLPINPAPANMGEICAQIVDELRTANPERAIRLERHGDLVGVWDASRVAQVISNLVGNAVQHGQDPILVEVHGLDDHVRVAVGNRGAPIPEDKLAALFEPFRKGDESQGLGLGLFIALEIVRAHRGTLEADTHDGGTTFTTAWPRAAA